MPTDWLTAAGLAADAVTEIEDGVWTRSTRTLTANTNLNDPTAAAIADAVWDETLSAHDTPGSTGHALVVASGNLIGNSSAPTAAQVADAVWDEATSGHTTGGTFGEQLKTDVDAILADTGELQTNQGNWLTATGFSTHSAADVWTTGGRTLSTQDWSTHNAADVAAIVGASGMIAQATWEYSTRTLTANTNFNDPTAAAIADAVWDEVLSAHDTPGSTGHALVTASGNLISGDWSVTGEPLTQAEIRSAVGLASANLDTQLGDIPTVSEFNARTLVAASYFDPAADTVANVTTVATTTNLTNLPTMPTDWLTSAGLSTAAADEIADHVWDETLADHDTPGSTGHALVAASGNLIGGATGPSASQIADAVWDEDTSGHTTGGTIGEQLKTDVDAILADTNELQTNQGNWLTATGFSTHNAADIWTASGRSLSSAISDFDDLTASGVNLVAVNGVDVTTYTEAEIVDAVWDEPVGDHQTAGTTGEALVASGVVTPADVWGYATRTLTANTNLNDPTAAAIADAVWDETLGDHDTPGSTGHALVIASGNLISGGWSTHSAADVWTTGGRTLSTQDWSTHSAADVAAIVGASGMIAQATWEYSTRTLTANTNLNDPTAAAIADAVWDEVLSAHDAAGTTGHALVTASGNLISGDWSTAASLSTVEGKIDTIDGIVDNILTDTSTTLDTKINTIDTNVDTLITGVNVTQINGSAATVYTDADISDAVWDETVSDHDTPGSTGHALVTSSGNLIGGAGTAPTASEVATAVWDRQLGSHLTVDTAGWALGVVASGIVTANTVQISGEYVTVRELATGDLDTTGLATTVQLEYWALQILNNCGGGGVG
jgi:hypothetical protein